MRIGILSDTHDRIPTLVQAFDIFGKQKVDSIIHCGDWTKLETLNTAADLAESQKITLYGVIGNRDDPQALASANALLPVPIVFPDGLVILELQTDGKSIVVYHGHHKPTLERLIADEKYDAVFTGHTHKPLITEQEGKTIVNPGSTAFSIPRRNEPRSIAVYDTETNTAQLLNFTVQ